VIHTVRAQALFASSLQPSERPTADHVADAVRDALAGYGPAGCAAFVAAEYGDHPDSAAARMRWALALTAGRVTPVLVAA
jgi:hypothetical protein